MRGDSLLRTRIEGRMEGKKKRGRPIMKLLDWMMKEDYSKLKGRAGHVGMLLGVRTYIGRQRTKKKKKDEMKAHNSPR